MKKEVEEKIENLKKAEPSELKSKTEELSTSLQKVGQAMYATKEEPAASPADGGEPKKNEPVEGEVVE
jgi:hypothetical protein